MMDLFRFVKGIILKPTTPDASNKREGAVYVDSADSNLKIWLNGLKRSVLTDSQAQTIKRKTIDGRDNTILKIPGSAIDQTNPIPLTSLQNSAELTESVGFFQNTDITGAEAETLTNGSDASTLHNHDTDYYTKTEVFNQTELGATTATSGASLIGVESIPEVTGNDVQTVLEVINAKASVSGSQGLPIEVVTTDITLDVTKHSYEIQAAGGYRTITLPKLGTGVGEAKPGKRFEVKATGDITGLMEGVLMLPTSPDTLENASQFEILTNNATYQFVAQTTNWAIM